MIIVQAFRLLHRNIMLILVPIIFDLIAFVIGLSFVGFYGERIFSIRLILEMGLPSTSHLLNIPLLVNSLDFLNIQKDTPSYMWMIVILMVLIGLFLQGGYIGSLFSIVNGNRLNFSSFIMQGKRSLLQLIILTIIIFLGKIIVTGFLVMFFKIIGVFASLAIFIVLRILYIYLEFAIVVDHVSIDKAIKYSNYYRKKTWVQTLPVVLLMYIVSCSISLFLHWFWSPFILICGIVIFGYLMSVIQFTFMIIMNEIRNHWITYRRS